MDRMLLSVVVARDHPVILSELSRDVPVLDPAFWVVERPKLSDPFRPT
jgi:hypothetical protein